MARHRLVDLDDPLVRADLVDDDAFRWSLQRGYLQQGIEPGGGDSPASAGSYGPAPITVTGPRSLLMMIP